MTFKEIKTYSRIEMKDKHLSKVVTSDRDKYIKVKHKIIFYASILTVLITSCNIAQAQLANSYPNDVGIENDPYVLYVEKFDDGISNILSRYNEKINTAGMVIDSDVPAGSLDPYSLNMTSLQGTNTGGYLYKNFNPGFDSVVYIRYYVKYPSISNGFFHHEGVWFGGYNPATNWPNPQAGTCGLGNSRLSITYETVWQQTNPPGMDTYLYWGDMQSWNGGSSCYGNTILSEGRTDYGKPASPDAPINTLDEWMCIEMMIKLNNPVSEYNGELAVWQNGVQLGHWGPGFPNGHWLKDKWYNNPLDPAFQGFRWRTDAKVNINWIWFLFYHSNPNAPSSYLKFDHFVMAKKYIGPLNDLTSIADHKNSLPIHIYPNPTSKNLTLDIPGSYSKKEIAIYNLLGENVFNAHAETEKTFLDVSHLVPGTYIIEVRSDKQLSRQKFSKE